MNKLLIGLLAVLMAFASPAEAGKRKKKNRGKAKYKITNTEAEVLVDTVRIRIHGLQSSDGFIICRIYEKKGWLKKEIQTVVSEIERRAGTCDFQVRPGTYGVAVFHDENKNGEPDSNNLGQPGEGVGASGNPTAIKEEPAWKKCKFSFAGGLLVKSVRMRYMPTEPEGPDW